MHVVLAFILLLTSDEYCVWGGDDKHVRAVLDNVMVTIYNIYSRVFIVTVASLALPDQKSLAKRTMQQ